MQQLKEKNIWLPEQINLRFHFPEPIKHEQLMQMHEACSRFCMMELIGSNNNNQNRAFYMCTVPELTTHGIHLRFLPACTHHNSDVFGRVNGGAVVVIVVARVVQGAQSLRRYLSTAVVSHRGCCNLWPSLQTPSSPPQMFDFNLVAG